MQAAEKDAPIGSKYDCPVGQKLFLEAEKCKSRRLAKYILSR